MIEIINSRVTASGQEQSSGASVAIVAKKSLKLSDGALLRSTSEEADGGTVRIVAPFLELSQQSDVEASNLGGFSSVSGNGGNVEIESVLMVLEDSQIRANAASQTGNAGRIEIDAKIFLQRGISELTATAAGGPELQGTVEVNVPEIDLPSAIAQLPESALDTSDQLAERCSARRSGESRGSFTVAGAGLRPGPEGWLSAWNPAEAKPVASVGLAAGRCH